MRSLLVVVAGLAIGWLAIAALDNAIPRTAIPYNRDALRSAVADGMSRADSATLVEAESGTAAPIIP
jgi:hypothetical protein